MTVTMLAGCGGNSDGGEKRSASQAVVIVSGGDATSPYTSKDEACATGLAAGNTDTALREFLLKQGYTVFTSPAMAGTRRPWTSTTNSADCLASISMIPLWRQ